MNQLRSSELRKWLISLFLIAGIFPSIQAAFACEKIDDRIQFKADCMQMEDGTMSSCAEKQDCLGSTDMNVSTNVSTNMSEDCCDLTQHFIATVKNNIQDISLDFILMLDGPQPPPAIPSDYFSFNINDSATLQHPPVFKFNIFSTSDIYLKTQRFRI